jgi:hypothetical protein
MVSLEPSKPKLMRKKILPQESSSGPLNKGFLDFRDN